MRKTIILAGIILVLLAMPVPSSASPLLIWPDSEYVNVEAAQNLTTWFAEQLGVQVNESDDGKWLEPNRTDLPEFLRATDAYVLPLIDGAIEARYVDSGVLRDIELRGNTSYVAASSEEESLVDMVHSIALNLGLDFVQPMMGIEYVVLNPETIREEHRWIVLQEEELEVGKPYYFNWLSVTFRASDLRVVAVNVQVWYEASATLNVTDSEALSVALDVASSNYSATHPRGDASAISVRNGTSFVHLVQVHWDAGNESTWMLDVWVDADTGEVLHTDGPYLTIGDRSGGWLAFDNPWIPIALTITIVVVLGLALFYRISTERALDHFTRGRIYGYIQANPGVNYTQVRESLDLKNGTLAYHLWVLERLGFIRSIRKGRVRQLFLSGTPVSRGSLVLSRLQYGILDLLKAEGPMTQTQIANHFDMSRQRVHYNVKTLRSMDLLESGENGHVRLLKEGMEAIEKWEGNLDT